MKSFIVKDAEPASDNLCPYCKSDTQILTPIGSHESFCGNCKRWFKAKLRDVVVHDAENKTELIQNWLETMRRIYTGVWRPIC